MFLTARHPTAKPTVATEPEGAIAAKLTKGELDAFAGDALALESRAARDPAYRVVRLAASPTAILCRADDATLRDALAAALKGLVDSGELARIHGKYATDGDAGTKK